MKQQAKHPAAAEPLSLAMQYGVSTLYRSIYDTPEKIEAMHAAARPVIAERRRAQFVAIDGGRDGGQH